MANIKMQNYPRSDDYLADAKLFPRPKGKVTADELSRAITKAFERSFKDKQGNTKVLAQTPEELVKLSDISRTILQCAEAHRQLGFEH